jgi:hypothetical protein
MSDMIVKVALEPDDQEALMRCMAKMDPKDAEGRLRSITIPDAIREAIRRMAKAGGR